MKALLPLTALALIAGCTASDVGTAVANAEAQETAKEARAEYEKSQDFDAIAEDAVAGMDTSGLGALEP